VPASGGASHGSHGITLDPSFFLQQSQLELPPTRYNGQTDTRVYFYFFLAWEVSKHFLAETKTTKKKKFGVP